MDDIHAATEAIRSHLSRGDLSDGLIFDAVRIRLIEIGEAVKNLTDEAVRGEPSIPWKQIARMRDHLAHRYFDTTHAVLQSTVETDLPELEAAIRRMATRLATEPAIDIDGRPPDGINEPTPPRGHRQA